ncbi:pyridoxal phosphate-dependent transferase [Penicillium angulare]|uniref:pyridoxal phosphate-dependent transferase n=1 Tax=Penicillium angulare TaxID=116970 RepID=UPI00254259E8|nr:pyridoxal phosphate-dependent transferase [Penicillium angulare]KAJ5289169.1 pyridoxal phosphate-dependent transferase [Penicillium angulare]
MGLPRAFEEGLHNALIRRQQTGQTFSLAPAVDKKEVIDFASNDTLSMVSSGALREELFRELARNPDFEIGACGSRVNEGTPYLAEVEKHLCQVHKAPDGLFFTTGYTANCAIFGTLPRDGDAIIYDALVHASIHDGIKATRASILKPFVHNSVLSLQQVVEKVKKDSPDINSGNRTVFVAIESIYGMDGDIAPAQEIVDVVKKCLPLGNYVLIVDEAHSNGLLGPNGAGLINELGLENEYAVRLQVVGKAHGASGAIVLCDPLIKRMLVNFARMFIFTAAPGFLLAATVKSAYNVVTGTDGDFRRRSLQENVRYFYGLLEESPEWPQIKDKGCLKLTSSKDWKSSSFLAPIVPLVTRERRCVDLRNKLFQNGFLVHSARFPAVPRDAERVRVVIHVDNTKAQITSLVKTIIEWASNELEENSSSYETRARL